MARAGRPRHSKLYIQPAAACWVVQPGKTPHHAAGITAAAQHQLGRHAAVCSLAPKGIGQSRHWQRASTKNPLGRSAHCPILPRPAVQARAAGVPPAHSNSVALPCLASTHCCRVAAEAMAAASTSPDMLLLAMPAALHPLAASSCPHYSDILISTPSNSLTCS